MKIKLLTSCSGLGFSYAQGQEVDNVDPIVGADLVRHGLAIEQQNEAETATAAVSGTAENASASVPDAQTAQDTVDSEPDPIDTSTRANPSQTVATGKGASGKKP
ncbi:hypothetical protein [Larkinella humicola]|uniref:Uncharacterized protein n=1 Tax=Larkinella humicola TaxID=2607654 RepID=A0A5N1JSE7_9BACT|nr:hypothetical protein [Larkinella humicola]KAA9357232.1 hypothetical protein F0P93_05710 [Larkinella humicola]